MNQRVLDAVVCVDEAVVELELKLLALVVDEVLCDELGAVVDEEVDEAEDDCVVLPSLIVTVRVFG